MGASESTDVLSMWETVENMPDEINPIIIRLYIWCKHSNYIYFVLVNISPALGIEFSLGWNKCALLKDLAELAIQNFCSYYESYPVDDDSHPRGR